MVRNSAMCCVPNCGKTRLDNVILHKYPNPIHEADRFRTWIYSVGGDVLSLDNQFIHKYRKVCHIHFEDKYITRSGRLSAIAVPTLQLKGLAAQTASLPVASNFQQPMQDDQVPRAPLINITNRYNAASDNASRPSTSRSNKYVSVKVTGIVISDKNGAVLRPLIGTLTINAIENVTTHHRILVRVRCIDYMRCIYSYSNCMCNCIVFSVLFLSLYICQIM